VRICAHLGGPCGNQRDISQNRVFTRSRFFANHCREAMPSGGGSSAIWIASDASVSNPSSRANSNARRNSGSFARQSWTVRHAGRPGCAQNNDSGLPVQSHTNSSSATCSGTGSQGRPGRRFATFVASL
jgi:hypothetical protein